MNAHDAFDLWLERYLDDGGDLPAHQDDLEDAFCAGYDAAIANRQA